MICRKHVRALKRIYRDYPNNTFRRDKMNRYLTYKDLAEYLQIHKATLRRYVKQGKLPVIRLGGAVRFDKEAIDEALGKMSG